LSEDELAQLLNTDTTAGNRTKQEWQRDLKNAIEHDQRGTAITRRADERRQEIETERSQMRAKLTEAGYGAQLAGIDNLSVASTDLLTIGLYYPAQ
jgi:hypothetical protein